MKLFMFIILSGFTSMSLAHEDGTMSSSVHGFYHVLMWAIVMSLIVKCVLWFQQRQRAKKEAKVRNNTQ